MRSPWVFPRSRWAHPLPATSATGPIATTLYAIVRDNVETLYAGVAAGSDGAPLPPFVRRKLDGYLDCGLLCRGFARMKCDACVEQHLVAFGCNGRGFCPSCMGRRMCQTDANLVEHVLPTVPLRQWVLTLPFELRGRLGFDGKLLGAIARIFTDSVLGWYRRRLRSSARERAESGAVVVVQRASSDLKLNPHLHVVFLDGVYDPGKSPEGDTAAQGGELVFRHPSAPFDHRCGRCPADRPRTHPPLPRAPRRHPRRRRGCCHRRRARRARPCPRPARQRRRLRPRARWPRAPSPPVELAFEGRPDVLITAPLSVREHGFSLRAATRAGAEDAKGREALLKYILRPLVATERVVAAPDGLVRVVLKKPFSDGTVAVDMDPLSLLCRLAATVPPPRFHTIRYAGVLSSHAKWRPLVVPKPQPDAPGDDANQGRAADPDPPRPGGASRYRPWAELLRRTFAIDVETCPKCGGRMRPLALVTEPKNVARFLRQLGAPTEAPASGSSLPATHRSSRPGSYDDVTTSGPHKWGRRGALNDDSQRGGPTCTGGSAAIRPACPPSERRPTFRARPGARATRKPLPKSAAPGRPPVRFAYALYFHRYATLRAKDPGMLLY